MCRVLLRNESGTRKTVSCNSRGGAVFRHIFCMDKILELFAFLRAWIRFFLDSMKKGGHFFSVKREERRRCSMALPVAATPVLKGRSAKKFEERIKADLKKPTRLVDTPKLEKTRMLVREYAGKRKKRI